MPRQRTVGRAAGAHRRVHLGRRRGRRVASWRDAVQPVEGGVRLLLEASPGAGHERFPDGYNPWRGRLGVRVREPARDGRANQAVLRVLAGFFGLPSSQVVLEAGAGDSRKTVLLVGVDATTVRARLAPALGA